MFEEFAYKPIMIAIIAMIVLVIIEFTVSFVQKKKLYRLNDTLTSINIGLFSQFVNSTFYVFGVAMYGLIEARYGTFDWSADSFLTWCFALVLYDFLYYWVHRAGHMVNLFWAAHVTHHSSEEFNLSTAMRQSSTGFYFKWVFYIPLAVLGVPVEVYAVVALIDLLYQYWVHTQLIGRMGWMEKVFVTPANHRVHHGQNDYCIDKNFGGIFCLWDKLFGTYADEKDDEPVVFGIRTPLQSWNPVWSNLHYYFALWLKVKSGRSWSEKLMYIFAEPAWQPNDMPPYNSKSPRVATFQKFTTQASAFGKSIGALFTCLASIALLFYLGKREFLSFETQLWVVLVSILMFATLGAYGRQQYLTTLQK